MKLHLSSVIFAIVITIAVFISMQGVYAAPNTTFPGDEFRAGGFTIEPMPIKDEIDLILQYCNSVDNKDEDITADLVNTGRLSTFFTGYTCNKAEEEKKEVYEFYEAFERLGEGFF